MDDEVDGGWVGGGGGEVGGEEVCYFEGWVDGEAGLEGLCGWFFGVSFGFFLSSGFLDEGSFSRVMDYYHVLRIRSLGS